MANLPNQDGLFAYFLHRLLPIPPSIVSASPATVLLIGANSGIGPAVAKILLSRQGLKNLLLTTRSREKSLQTKQHLARFCPANAKIVAFEVDLTDYDSVRELVRRLNASSDSSPRPHQHCDLERWPNDEHIRGRPRQLYSLYSSCRTCLSICSSDGHYFGTPLSTLYNSSDGIFGYLNERSSFSSNSAHLTFKLLGILFGRALREKLDPAEALVNMINPGIARTKLFRDRGWWFCLLTWLFGRGVDVAARVVIQGALGDDGVVHGGFYSEGRDTKPLPELFKHGRELQERLWCETLDLLRAEYEGITLALIQVHSDELREMTGALPGIVPKISTPPQSRSQKFSMSHKIQTPFALSEEMHIIESQILTQARGTW
ncbi:hypothetical protein HOY80DRAFT_1057024 [Tuber brumale]|nr:hypothetical protein HOY80DRAFT_1057024 [Tuber brumale]